MLSQGPVSSATCSGAGLGAACLPTLRRMQAHAAGVGLLIMAGTRPVSSARSPGRQEGTTEPMKRTKHQRLLWVPNLYQKMY